MMEWKDYRPEDSNEIDTWLDDETVRQTGIENGWAAEVRYWSENADMDGFWCKSVFEGNALIGALYLIEWKDEDTNGFTIGEIVVKPTLRGRGIGTGMLTELCRDPVGIIGKRINTLEACIFSTNEASKQCFRKAGFTLKERENDKTAVDAYRTFM